MQARFLLGPAGSGKTFRCLAEIRAELSASPEGPQLVLLAPKQATFQLERQLLAGPALQGYTRLRILSFERLAEVSLKELRIAPPRLLSEQGRVMVLRALLLRHEKELQLFRKSARRPGFAQQLSELLAEFQQHQLSPAKLRRLAGRLDLAAELRNKLCDLALLLEAYQRWLGEHQLQDAHHLLDSATEALQAESRIAGRKPGAGDYALNISDLWLDGFAEMTPAEMDLLGAILPFCERATLGFCLDESAAQAGEARTSWLSQWAIIRKTYQECQRRVKALPMAEVSVEHLPRDPQKNRFAGNPKLAHLEAAWAGTDLGMPQLVGDSGSATSHAVPGENSLAGESGGKSSHAKTEDALRIVVCSDAEAEATFAAREILRFVRSGGRFRDVAVLVRDLERYHKPVERAFRRYEIPCFIDRRESVAHHPLAELTRSALRTVAFDWQHEDWFAALKAGFSPADETEIDGLENEALARGWRGAKWTLPLPISEDPVLEKSVELLRQSLVPPFTELARRLKSRDGQVTGAQLAEALRELWRTLKVEAQLREWADEIVAISESASGDPQSAIHLTVWDQMNVWVDNLELAFPRDLLRLRDWLLILEAGLASLTVGVIPPALDQVLVGAIDRSRNPDLKLALVLGLNEGIFPAAPVAPTLLTDTDRDALVAEGASLGPAWRDRLAREQYLGYIAFTRANQKLVATYTRKDADGKVRNPSQFVSHLRRLFPDLIQEESHGDEDWREAEHACELIAPLVAAQYAAERRSPTRRESNDDAQSVGSESGAPIDVRSQLFQLPILATLQNRLHHLRNPDPAERLSSALAEKLYGSVLHSSVSRLEEFAACPFRFFVHSGLRAEERKQFELDAREQGSFQHEALKLFHEELRAKNQRWRDITPAEARARIGRIAAALLPDYREGLLRETERSRFTALVLTESLQDFVEVLVFWMREQYDFEPAAVELAFGSTPPKPAADFSPTEKTAGLLQGLLPFAAGLAVDSSGLPAWEIELASGQKLALQGRIDRVDLWREPGSDAALCVVMDYKSRHKQIDPVLMQHGVQLQLPAYLGVLRQWRNPRRLFGVARLIPAGVFYVSLRGKYERAGNRAEVFGGADAARKLAYRHAGRFDASLVRKLDRRPHATEGDQFNYRVTKTGAPAANAAEALERAKFEALLDNTQAQLATMGARIFAGDAAVDPYRKGGITPCAQCEYAAICRIDRWTHHYRLLRKAEAAGNEN